MGVLGMMIGRRDDEMRFLFSIVVLGAAALYYAFKQSGGYKWVYGNGRKVEVSETVDTFQRISVHHSIKLDVVKGSSNDLTIEIDENLVEYLNVYTEAGCLHLGIQPDVIIKRGCIQARVTAEGLKSIRGTGATEISLRSGVTDPSQFEVKLTGACNFTGELASKDLIFTSSGAASCKVDVDGQRFSLKLTGASEFNARGNLEHLCVKASGASSINGKDLMVNSADVNLSGASSVKVKVLKHADVTASGGSDIVLYGQPKIGMQSIGKASSFKIK